MLNLSLIRTLSGLFCLLIMANQLRAQTATIFGVIKDSTTQEVLGAVNLLVGETGTSSDILTGEFRLTVPAGAQKLSISYVGYNPKDIDLNLSEGETKQLDIFLSEVATLLNTATVTSSRFEKPLGEVTVSMEVIQPDLIKNTNTVAVNEVLGRVPGVNMIDGQVDIRGGAGFAQGTGSRVMILMDDMPILQADAGLPNWRDLPTENIAQIEVLKGAASALYGSAAMNGIINIRTAYPTEKPYTNISLFHTSYFSPKDTLNQWWNETNRPYEAGVQIAHRQKLSKKLDLVAGGNFYQNSSFIRGSGQDTNPDYNHKLRKTIHLRYKATERLSLFLNWNTNIGSEQRHLFWTQRLGQSLYEADPTALPIKGRNFRVSVDPSATYYDNNENRHRLQTRYYYINNANANGQSNKSHYVYGEYQFQRRFKQFDNLDLAAGVVGSNTNVTAEVYGGYVFKLANAAAYAQLEKKFFEKLTLSLGMRYEFYHLTAPDSVAFGIFGRKKAAGSEQEAKPIMRFGANYQLGKATYARASFGQAYRFPTILEKFVSTSAGGGIRTYPNPSLTSETGWSAEIGVKQGFKLSNWMGFVDVAGFWTEYQNMTEFQANSSIFGFWVQNVGDTRISGIDANITGLGKIGKVDVSLITGYTYINPIFQNFDSLTQEGSSSDKNVLKYRFRHTYKFDGQATYKNVSLGLTLNYFSFMEAIDRYLDDRINYPTIPKFREDHQGGTWLVGARLAYTYKAAKIALIGQNLLNTEFSVRAGVLEAPRNVAVRGDFTF